MPASVIEDEEEEVWDRATQSSESSSIVVTEAPKRDPMSANVDFVNTFSENGAASEPSRVGSETEEDLCFEPSEKNDVHSEARETKDGPRRETAPDGAQVLVERSVLDPETPETAVEAPRSESREHGNGTTVIVGSAETLALSE